MTKSALKAQSPSAPSGTILVDFKQLASSPYQRRSPFDPGLRDLAISLFDLGLINPPTVRLPSAFTKRAHPEAKYELETGHRRVKAVELLHTLRLNREERADSKISTLIPVTLITEDDSMTTPDAALRTLAENTHRKALTPYEEALTVAACYDLLRDKAPNASYDVLAQRLGFSRTRAFEGVNIAKMITDEVLKDAGFVLADGTVDQAKVARLKKQALRDAASAPSRRMMLKYLQKGLLPAAETDETASQDLLPVAEAGNEERPSGKKWKKVSSGAPTASKASSAFDARPSRDVGFEYERFRAKGEFHLHIRPKPSGLSPEEAEEKLDELMPAVALLSERVLQSGEHGDQRYFLIDDRHAAAVFFPGGLGIMSDAELDRLITKLRHLREPL